MFLLETQNLHPSTLLCLEAIQALPEDFAATTILDLGCGNGILSIVAANIWPAAKIEAVDISPNAVKDAQAAVQKQGLETRINVQRNDVFRALKDGFGALNCTFDIITCNLLSDILIPAAPQLKETLNIGGYAILSGILAWRAEEIEAVYTGLGFEIVRKFESSPWVAYTLCHKTETIPYSIVTKA